MNIDKEFWNKLVINRRLATADTVSNDEYRSAFDMDHDRIVYSNFFRRMHDKTQVFPYAPLSISGQARSRLSHSLEVSCVARSLGIQLGRKLVNLGVDVTPYDIGMIVASACLAHDIGNPPFGHSGEYAIQQWTQKNLASELTDQWERSDIFNFEGNAQGFRILTRLESFQRSGGLRPTLSTLSAFSKYPCASILTDRNSTDPARKKFGYFKSDRCSFAEVYKDSAIQVTDSEQRAYARHPFAYFTEAADDICYAVVDLEDAYHLGVISFTDLYDFLKPIAQTDPQFSERTDYDQDTRVARLRSATISTLINQVMEVSLNNLEALQDFSYNRSLIDDIRSADLYRDIKKYSKHTIYNSSRVLEIECAGFKTLGGLLDIFVPSVLTNTPSAQDSISRKIIPSRFLMRHENLIDSRCESLRIEALSKYERILSVTDYISGMTDRYAVELYQRLSGIKLPQY